MRVWIASKWDNGVLQGVILPTVQAHVPPTPPQTPVIIIVPNMAGTSGNLLYFLIY